MGKAKPKMPINRNLENLKENKIIKCFGRLFGLILPIATGFMFAVIAFGWYRVDEGFNCYAVEYPDMQ